MEPLKILLVKNGRNHMAGVARSAELVREALTSIGDEVVVTVHPEPELVSRFDLVWLYGWFHGNDGRSGTGTDAPRLRRLLAGEGPPVLLNAAPNGTAARDAWILETLENNPRAIAAVWTAMAEGRLGIHPRVACLPKAFRHDVPAHVPPFSARGHYCVGDVADFAHGHITRRSVAQVHELMALLREEVRGIKFSAYQGWGNRMRLRVDLLSRNRAVFLPFLSKQRAIIHLGPHESFGMTLMEAQRVGTPVVYPHMPQSLSEYVGNTGFRYRSDEEIVEAVKILEDEDAWNRVSAASIDNARARSCHPHAPMLHYAIRCALARWRACG